MTEAARGGWRGWLKWGAVVVGLLLAPLVCIADAVAVIWLYRDAEGATFLLLLIPGILALLAIEAAGLMASLSTGLARLRHTLPITAAQAGLLFAYAFSFAGAQSWMLGLQGTETTCTVLGVDVRRERDTWNANPNPYDPETGWITHHDHELDCGDVRAPTELTTGARALEVGDSVAVVYDPSPAGGSWGVAPATEVRAGGPAMDLSVVFVGGGTGMWTLAVLGYGTVAARRYERSRRAVGDPGRTVP
ncbi:hypothetical protein [Streptomyces phytophilus]|uniref:hypothetical protein n=1 Tax=Streptomyces phytophilus TaxID=722715 RepID=UPI0015F11FDC|nr:hypothetical protein [Streptomyces phytophilus]